MRKVAPLLKLFKRSGDVPLVYYVFDLLSLEGKGLRDQPPSARRKALANVLKGAPDNIRLSDELRGSKDELVRVAKEFDLEGLVAKRKTSVYESGRRSGAWVKFKITKAQEFVIGGYTLPEGGRKYFGEMDVSRGRFFPIKRSSKTQCLKQWARQFEHLSSLSAPFM
jgi:bifunctional non-homologous end joining protein LigD